MLTRNHHYHSAKLLPVAISDLFIKDTVNLYAHFYLMVRAIKLAVDSTFVKSWMFVRILILFINPSSPSAALRTALTYWVSYKNDTSPESFYPLVWSSPLVVNQPKNIYSEVHQISRG